MRMSTDSQTGGWITLREPFTISTEIKKSRFIAHGAPVSHRDEAMAFLASVRDDTATHNCWAYKIGTDYRFSDDGEPGGTAGKPILTAIEGSGVDGVMVVVVRFFGGIKLGAGGLVRAYGNAAATCLGHGEKVTVIPTVRRLFNVPFDCIGCVYPLLDRHSACRNAETYTDTCVTFDVTLPHMGLAAFQRDLIDATSGRVDGLRVPEDTAQNDEK
jgi:uncharacterized YigZ family protein